MPRYEIAPHDVQGPFSEAGQGEGPALESIETTACEEGGEIHFFSGYSAREMAQRHRRDSGGTMYVNSVSRKIIRKEFHLATNAPVYYAIAKSPVYTLIRSDGRVVRAIWPRLEN